MVCFSMAFRGEQYESKLHLLDATPSGWMAWQSIYQNTSDG